MLPQSGSTESKNFDRKASCKRFRKKLLLIKGESCYRDKGAVKEPEKREKVLSSEKESLKSRGDPCRGSDYYSSKLSGTKLTDY
jgi:hypothetical protein